MSHAIASHMLNSLKGVETLLDIVTSLAVSLIIC